MDRHARSHAQLAGIDALLFDAPKLAIHHLRSARRGRGGCNLRRRTARDQQQAERENIAHETGEQEKYGGEHAATAVEHDAR